LDPNIVAIGFIIFLGLIALEIPVVFALGFGSIVTLILQGTFPLALIPQRIFVALDSFPLLAIPLFIFVGQSMNTCEITNKLFRFARILVGHIRGGLAHVNIVASIFFAGMSGSAVADASGLGLVEIKAMQDEGFDADFSCAVTAASSTIGPIIPPSIPLVIYAYMANTSVGRLFLGGVLPGLLMGVSMMVLVYFISIRRGYKKDKFPPLKEIFKAFIEAIPALLTPVIMIGGIVSGIFTPTEGGAVTAVYTLFLGFILYRNLTFKDFVNNLKITARTSATVLLIIGFASIFSWVTTVARIPQLIVPFILGITTNKIIILALINIILLIAGCIMESIAILTISLPVLFPIVMNLGVDPVHFGVMMILNLMIGLVTPPFGLCLFAVSGVGHISVGRVIKATLPFLIPLIFTLILVTYFPEITLWFPNLIMGK